VQNGYVYKYLDSCFLRYRTDFIIDGKLLDEQKCAKLADYGDRYGSVGDLDEIVAEKMATVRQIEKCQHSANDLRRTLKKRGCLSSNAARPLRRMPGIVPIGFATSGFASL
jgi:hypothetical protein